MSPGARIIPWMLAVLPSCGSAPPSVPVTGAACGSSRCEMEVWPRLVVAESVPPDSGAAPIQVSALIDGKVFAPAIQGGCPDGFDVIDCQFGFYGYPGLQTMTLEVTAMGGSASAIINLHPFNYCGSELAYVHVSVDGSLRPSIGDPQYVSPCQLAP